MKHNAYREGKVHVRKEQCSTCIFRKGNLMHLRSGRVRGMVDEACEQNSAIICHATLDRNNAVCRGFYDRHAQDSASLRLAQALDMIEED